MTTGGETQGQERMSMDDTEVVGRMAYVRVSQGHDNYIALMRELRQRISDAAAKDAEIALLRADNAALLKTGSVLRDPYDDNSPAVLEAIDVLAQPHPGTALLEEMKRLKDEGETARGMAELLYHRMLANGIAAESQATKDAVQTVGRWLEITAK